MHDTHEYCNRNLDIENYKMDKRVGGKMRANAITVVDFSGQRWRTASIDAETEWG